MSAVKGQSSYLSHVNGIRAIAILGVLFYHLNAEYCPVGYFGVDIFLVICGFLLFRKLLSPEEIRVFRYGNYLVGKAWRILPSWFVLTLAVMVLAVGLMVSHREISVFYTARSSALLYADYYIDRVGGDYFNTLAQQNPLLHLWYLSITEQLYILVPIIIVPIVRMFSRRVALCVIGGISLFSLAYFVLSTTRLLPVALQTELLGITGSRTAYYHLLPRFWEVGAGTVIGSLPSLALFPRWRQFLASVSLLGILVSFFLYKTGSNSSYLTVVCTVLLLRYGGAGRVAAILNNRLLQWVGTISFSLYLWHWPIMVFWKYCCFDNPGLWDEAGMVLLSFLLAWGAWRWIETFRIPSAGRWGGLWRCAIWGLPPAMVALTVLGNYHAAGRNSYTWNHSLVPSFREDARVLQGVLSRETDPTLTPASLFTPRSIGNPESNSSEPFFFLMGDSHSEHLYEGAYLACQRRGIRGVYFGRSFWQIVQLSSDGAGEFIYPDLDVPTYRYLEAHPEIKYVVLAVYWDLNMNFHAADVRLANNDLGNVYSAESYRAFMEARIRKLCVSIHAMGKKVILLGDVPSFDENELSPIDRWERCMQLGIEYTDVVIIPAEHVRKQAEEVRFFQSLVAEGLACYIDVAPSLLVDGLYRSRIGDEFMYKDTNHLTPAASRRVGEYLVERILEVAAKDGFVPPSSVPPHSEAAREE